MILPGNSDPSVVSRPLALMVAMIYILGSEALAELFRASPNSAEFYPARLSHVDVSGRPAQHRVRGF